MSADTADLTSEYGQPDGFSYPPGTALLGFQHNEGAAVQEPTLDLDDGGGLTWTLTDDPANSRMKLAGQVTGLVSPHGSTVVGGDGVDPGAVLTATALTGLFASVAVNAGNVFVSSTVAGDNVDYRYTIAADGTMQWGSGAAARDTNLYRGNVGQVKTDNLMYAVGGFIGQVVAGNNMFRNFLLGTDANPAFRILGNGSMAWGAGGGSATDTQFDRTGVATLTLTGALIVTNGLQSTGPTNPIGYRTGAGGAATCATGASVIKNTVCGQITAAAAVATGGTGQYTVNNSTVGATDTVHVTIVSTTVLLQRVHVIITGAGAFTIVYENASGVSVTPKFNFAVIKAVTA